jgi:hypothetical protein
MALSTTLAGSQGCVAQAQRVCELDSPKRLKSGCTIQVMLAVAHDSLNLVAAHSTRRLHCYLSPTQTDSTNKRKNTAGSRYACVLDLRPGGRRGTKKSVGLSLGLLSRPFS